MYSFFPRDGSDFIFVCFIDLPVHSLRICCQLLTLLRQKCMQTVYIVRIWEFSSGLPQLPDLAHIGNDVEHHNPL